MSNGPLTTLGIARCRDLVQLYYGGRMVAITKHQQFTLGANAVQLFTADPRRIAYDLFIAEATAVAAAGVKIAPQLDNIATVGEVVALPIGDTIIVSRDFRTSLDAVTQAQWALLVSGNAVVSTREVLLSPLPVDEYV